MLEISVPKVRWIAFMVVVVFGSTVFDRFVVGLIKRGSGCKG